MGALRGVKTHFQTHGSIHAVWLIGLLIAIISWLLLGERDGNVVRDYISFAASVASLVLAVVAIFYALISNQSFSETVGSLKSTTENVHKAARNIADSSSILADHSERMLGEVSRVPTAVQALSERMEAALAQSQVQAPQSVDSAALDSENGSETVKFFYDTVFGGKACLYIVALSQLKNKPFSTSEIFQDNVNQSVCENFLGGYLHALRGTHIFGIDIEFSDSASRRTFSVVSLGQFSASDIIREFSSIGPADNIIRKNIDKYFFGEQADSEPPLSASDESS